MYKYIIGITKKEMSWDVAVFRVDKENTENPIQPINQVSNLQMNEVFTQLDFYKKHYKSDNVLLASSSRYLKELLEEEKYQVFFELNPEDL